MRLAGRATAPSTRREAALTPTGRTLLLFVLGGGSCRTSVATVQEFQ